MNTKTHIITGLLILWTSLACMLVEKLAMVPFSESRVDPPTTFSRKASVLQACLERLDQALQTRPFAPIGNRVYEELDAEFNLVIYKVEGNGIKDPVILYVPSDYRKYQEDTAAHRRIWDFYIAIIPPELRKLVKEFVIYTDGPEGNTSAWVRPASEYPGYWQIGFDLLDSDYPPLLADSLIHETAHLLTLNSSQIPYEENRYYSFDGKQNVPACAQVAVDGGCSLPNSYINLFYQRFWKDIYADWWDTYQEAQKTDSDPEYWQTMEQFYDQHADLFLNDYAATKIEEDVAESFSFFVLNDRPRGNSLPEEKVAFYYEFPELVEYRQQIIGGLCSYLK